MGGPHNNNREWTDVDGVVVNVFEHAGVVVDLSLEEPRRRRWRTVSRVGRLQVETGRSTHRQTSNLLFEERSLVRWPALYTQQHATITTSCCSLPHSKSCYVELNMVLYQDMVQKWPRGERVTVETAPGRITAVTPHKWHIHYQQHCKIYCQWPRGSHGDR